MPKDKKKQKVPDHPLPPLYSAEDIPSQNCKDFLIELIVRYYEEINLRTLESMYVRYCEEGPEMFKHDMHIRMTEHLMAPQWNVDYQKRGRSKFVDARVHNSLWNARTRARPQPRPFDRSPEAVQPVSRGCRTRRPRPSERSANESVGVGPSTPFRSLPTPFLAPPPPYSLPLSEFLKAFLFLEASQSFTVHI